MSRFTIEIAGIMGVVKVDRDYILNSVDSSTADNIVVNDNADSEELFLVIFQSDFDKTFVVSFDEIGKFLEQFKVKDIKTVLENIKSSPKYNGEGILEDSLYTIWYPIEVVIDTNVTPEQIENSRSLYEAEDGEKEYSCAITFRHKDSNREQYDVIPRSKEDLFIKDITELIIQRASLDQSYYYYGKTREEIYDDLKEKLSS